MEQGEQSLVVQNQCPPPSPIAIPCTRSQSTSAVLCAAIRAPRAGVSLPLSPFYMSCHHGSGEKIVFSGSY